MISINSIIIQGTGRTADPDVERAWDNLKSLKVADRANGGAGGGHDGGKEGSSGIPGTSGTSGESIKASGTDEGTPGSDSLVKMVGNLKMVEGR